MLSCIVFVTFFNVINMLETCLPSFMVEYVNYQNRELE